ncbi:hypothetical protein [Halomonas sp. PA16-9]|uniref:hypothetical protein n=1 Tax=Halomonas sp. PA16-9 TaxID=2576841 RepID=UPI0030EDA181
MKKVVVCDDCWLVIASEFSFSKLVVGCELAFRPYKSKFSLFGLRVNGGESIVVTSVNALAIKALFNELIDPGLREN